MNSMKMESLNTYNEKRKKLTDTVTEQLDKAEALSMEHIILVEQLKSKIPRHTDTTVPSLSLQLPPLLR